MKRRIAKFPLIALFAALVPLLAGCGRDGPKTYPVSGKVVLPGGESAKLAGHHIEAALEGDPTVRASGVIGSDGKFTLETLQGGAVLKGALEGKYQVRIVPADEDGDGNKLKKPSVASRNLQFKSSGLTFQVPTVGEVTLELSP